MDRSLSGLSPNVQTRVTLSGANAPLGLAIKMIETCKLPDHSQILVQQRNLLGVKTSFFVGKKLKLGSTLIVNLSIPGSAENDRWI